MSDLQRLVAFRVISASALIMATGLAMAAGPAAGEGATPGTGTTPAANASPTTPTTAAPSTTRRTSGTPAAGSGESKTTKAAPGSRGGSGTDPTRRPAGQAPNPAYDADPDEINGGPVPGRVSIERRRTINMPRDFCGSVEQTEAWRAQVRRFYDELQEARLLPSPEGEVSGVRGGGTRATTLSPAGSPEGKDDPILTPQAFSRTNLLWRPILPVPAGADFFADPDSFVRGPLYPGVANADQNGDGRRDGDVDGDGDVDFVTNSFPRNPAIVFFSFLEAPDIDINWDTGDDQINTIGVLTGEMDDGMTPEREDLAETDGIPETWTAPPPGYAARRLDIVIPPAPGATTEPEVSAALTALGLPGQLWRPDRPAFRNGSFGEAAFYLFQSRSGPVSGDGSADAMDTWPASAIPSAAVRQGILTAMRAIEREANVLFVQRPRGTMLPTEFPLTPIGDPYNPAATLIAPFGESPNEPADDYPWLLIVEDGTSPTSFAAGFGLSRTPSNIDLANDDVNGDGFPDFIDANQDGFLEFAPSIPVANPQPEPAGAMGPGVGPATTGGGMMANGLLDINGDGVFSEFFVGPIRSFPPFLADALGTMYIPGVVLDSNNDGFPDAFDRDLNGLPDDMNGIDANGDGLLDDFLENVADGNADLVIGGASPDGFFDGDGVADPSPFRLTQGFLEAVPTMLVTMSTADTAVATHELLHALGFIHEHQRPDRDSFITVQFGNIQDQIISQYTIQDATDDPINLGLTARTGQYDFESIMHYSPQTGSRGVGQPTFIVNEPFRLAFARIAGNARFMSDLDIELLVQLYGVNPVRAESFPWFLGEDPICPVDVDGDEIQTPADVTLFRRLWQSNNPSADTNFDFVVDGLDIITFFNALSATGYGPCGFTPIEFRARNNLPG